MQTILKQNEHAELHKGGVYQGVARASRINREASKDLQGGCQEAGVVEKGDFKEGDQQPTLQLCRTGLIQHDRQCNSRGTS